MLTAIAAHAPVELARSEPTLLTESELTERKEMALSSASSHIQLTGELLAQMALEARLAHDHYLSRRSREVRWFYRIGIWSYSGLGAVVAAAVGGAVLAFSAWPQWLRYAVGSISMVAAFIGALKPSDFLRRDLQRMDLYLALHRLIWQYILLELPDADEVGANVKVAEFGLVLDSIRGIDPSSLRSSASSSPSPREPSSPNPG
jgi:hypothetical protein